MQIIIKEREYEYQSDFDEGWEFSAGDYFKFPVSIGQHPCFIKRFAGSPGKIPGWHLLQAVKASFQPGLPRVHDIARVEEKGREVHYVFCECMDGDTLDKMIQQGERPDCNKLTEDLFLALGSIHRHEYWFADFCEKNIFCTSAGRFFLIDLDSSQHSTTLPNKEVYACREYWALVFSFFIGRAGMADFRPSDISGILLNYIQVVFLILRIRTGLADGVEEYKSRAFIEKLPVLLDKSVPEYRELFIRLLTNGTGSPDPSDIQQIKDLLLQRIVNEGKGDPIPLPDNREDEQYDHRNPLPGPAPSPEPAKQLPVISWFKSDKKRLKKGGSFELRWETRFSSSVILERNGMPYKKLSDGEQGISLTEKYDGKEKKIVYSLSASNDAGQVRSEKHLLIVGPARLNVLFLVIPALLLLALLLMFSLLKGRETVHSNTDTVTHAVILLPDSSKIYAAERHRKDSLDREDSLRNVKENNMRLAREAIIRKNQKEAARQAGEDSIRRTRELAIRKAEADSAKARQERLAASIKKVPEKALLEKRLLDSVKVLNSRYGTGIFHLNRRLQLLLQNSSGYQLDNIVLEITLGPAYKTERKVLSDIRPHSTVILLKALPKNSEAGGRVLAIHLEKYEP